MNNLIEIIAACRRGNARAEKQLFDHYGETCFRLALGYVGNSTDAEDVVTQAFVKAFRGMGKTNFDHPAAFKSWLKKIVVNEALQLLRKQRRSAKNGQLVPLTRTELAKTSKATDLLETSDLHRQIDLLPLGYRRVLRLFAINGMSHAEIGRKLKISEGTSRSQLSKARNLLRKKLKANGYD